MYDIIGILLVWHLYAHGGPHVTNPYDALDLTVQSLPAPRTSDPDLGPPPVWTSDLGPPVSDTWW